MTRKRSHTRRTARSNPRGRIDVRRGGYGFVQTAEGEYFIPRKRMHGAFPGDLVEIAPMGRSAGHGGRASGTDKRKRVARVVSVVERACEDVVGYFRHAEPFGVVEPADPLIQHDIFTQLADNPDIPDGAIVRVQITTFPDRNTAATGRIVEVLGDEDDERMAIDLIVAHEKLETAFSEASLAQAAAAGLDEEGALAEGYRDLRDRFVFTIDPVDARDFDDAVSLEEATLPDGTSGWRLGVHIADVSHYVAWDSPIDLDARRRATSVYLVDRVIPMLPERLSNDMCSLRPGEVRRTMTVDLYLDARCEVVRAEPYPALIRSNARLTYDEAQELLESDNLSARTAGADAPACPRSDDGSACESSLLRNRGRIGPRRAGFLGPVGAAGSDLVGELQRRLRGLSGIAKQRAARREKAGGLDFDTVEAKVRLDGEGRPVGIDLRERTCATQLIEESMIMANEAVARHLRDAGFPCIYRVHGKPAPDALVGLVPVLAEFGWFKDIDEARFVAGNPHAVQSVLAAVEGRPEGALVTTLVLRAMQRAVYSPQLDGHYGLASSAYAHFTSPIRRYPDLVVHRMLKAALFGRPEKFGQEVSSLAWLAEHSSEMERIAERAARESQDVKIVEFMEGHVGETFSALVSGVTTFGLFVRLDNTAEGVIEMADLGHEYFILDPVRHLLTGSDTGREYRLGRRLAVRLVEADRRIHQLCFRPVH